MRTVYFSKGRLIFSIIFAIAIPFVALPMLFAGPFLGILGMVFLVCAPMIAISNAKRLFGDRVAVQFNASQVIFAKTWSRQTFSWSQVRSVDATQMVMRLWGIIPVSRTNFVDLKVEGGLLGMSRKIRLAQKMLDITANEFVELVGQMQLAKANHAAANVKVVPPVHSAPQPSVAAHAPAAGQTRMFGSARDPLEGAPRGPMDLPARFLQNEVAAAHGVQQSQPASNAAPAPQFDDPRVGALEAQSFDPDAIMARYLASKAAEQAEQAPEPDRPAPLPGAAQPVSTATPHRPIFGRKAA